MKSKRGKETEGSEWRAKFAASRLIGLAVIMGAAIAMLGGCYERQLAPAVEYSQDDVDTLSKEIENFDWE